MNREKCISIINGLTLKSKSQGLKSHEQNLLSSLNVWLRIREIELIVENLVLKSKSQGLNAYDRELLEELEISIEKYKKEQAKLNTILELKLI